MTPAEFKQFAHDEMDVGARIVKAAGDQGTVTISPPGEAEARRGRRRANRGGRQAIESDLRRRTAEAEARARPVSRYIVALTEPPSMTRFWPMTNPASALQRNAHALPNSSGVPKRPAGFSATRAARNVS